MPSSHHRHGQDKARLSCPVRVGGVNWIGDKSRQFSVGIVLNVFESEQFCRVPHFETGQNCRKTKHVEFRNFLSPTVLIDLSPIQFTPPTPTWQDKTVLSCPCRRCELSIRKPVDKFCRVAPPGELNQHATTRDMPRDNINCTFHHVAHKKYRKCFLMPRIFTTRECDVVMRSVAFVCMPQSLCLSVQF